MNNRLIISPNQIAILMLAFMAALKIAVARKIVYVYHLR